MSSDLSSEVIEEISQALCQGKKIEAIKIYRETTGQGLKESKEFIDALIPQLIEKDPEKYAQIGKASDGCAGMILLAAICSCGVVATRFLLGFLVIVFTQSMNTTFAQSTQNAKTDIKKVVEKQETASQKYDSIEKYRKMQVSGWQLIVHRDLIENEPKLWSHVEEELKHQFYQIQRRVPAPAVKKLRIVPIWVELNEGHHASLVYHPNRQWLLNNNMHPEKARCVEVANARNFLNWTIAQPFSILHEMAHAWHDRYMPDGHGNSEVALTFERARQKELYGPVLHINEKLRQAYAAKNPMEYFAESSEAFFGTNDFYPFVRSELKQYDLQMHDLLVRTWGVKSGK